FFNLGEVLSGLNIGTENPVGARAYITASDVTAAGGISVHAVSAEDILAVEHSVAIAIQANLSGEENLVVTVSAVIALNKISTETLAYIEDSSISAGSAGVIVTAGDAATISSDAFAPAISLAATLGGSSSIGVAVGLGLGRNTVTQEVAAYL